MADTGLADLVRQIAFYQGGGQAPGTRDVDKISNIFGDVSDLGNQMTTTVKNVLENKKRNIEMQKMAAEKTKLDIENTPAVDALGTPIIKGQLNAAQAAPIPPEDLISGKLDTYQKGIDSATDQAKGLQNELGGLTLGQAKTLSEVRKGMRDSNPTEDLQPLSKMMTYEAAKSVVPDLTPEAYATETIGSLRQRVGASKQADLNNSRDKNLDLRVNNAIVATGNELMNTLRPIREQKMALASSSNLNDLVRSGNSNAAAALGAQQARAVSEHGVLTDADVLRYIRSGLIPQRIGDIMSQWFIGKPTNATLSEIAQVNEYMKKALDFKEKELIDQQANRIVANYGIDPQEAIQRLGYQINNGNYSIQSPTPNNGGGVPSPAPAIGGGNSFSGKTKSGISYTVK